jgi:hypothetical protein
MCLIIKPKQNPEIATEDITCYKVLYYNSVSNEYSTVFQRAVVKAESVYESILTVADNGIYVAVEEGLHSFVHIEDANMLTSFFNFAPLVDIENNYKLKCVIAKCLIPKGSTYYAGVFETFTKKSESYASNKLAYLEIIK